MAQRRFQAIAESRPGERLGPLLRRRWPAYRRWWSSEGVERRPSFAACRRALREHMPELVPAWEAIVDAASGGDEEARFLSLWCPPGFATGCTQAVWTRGEPALLRNYDYAPQAFDAVVLRTLWSGHAVLAMADCVWGVLDGLNQDGLAVSLAFGGSSEQTDGFGVALVLRYVLETCRTIEAAHAVLRRVPVHQAYNLAFLDAHGQRLTLAIAPGREPVVRPLPFSANRLLAHGWPEQPSVIDTVRREALLQALWDDPDLDLEALTRRFLEPPLFRPLGADGWGTLYTACWRPGPGSLDLVWPEQSWRQSLAGFSEGERLVQWS